jgi:hypothetical protein
MLTKEMNPASDDERIAVMVRKILCRNPTESEIRLRRRAFMMEATADSTTANGAVIDPERGWVLLAHALLASNEFTFLD